MFDQFKEKIQLVQQDLNAGLKTLSEKAREVSRSKKLPGELHVLESKPASLSALKPDSIDAGEEILNRFQQSWKQIHVNIECCAEKASKVDRDIQDLAEKHDRQVQHWKQLEATVKDVPDMVKQIQMLAVTLGKLEANFEEIEGMLGVLEDTLEEEELLNNKKIQVGELVGYRDQKHKERQLRRERLHDEYAQKFKRIEEKEDAKKKERQKAYQEVFAADMAHYRTHGQTSKLQVAQSSQDDESILDDFEISVNADDQQALDDFLGPDESPEVVAGVKIPEDGYDGDDDDNEVGAVIEGDQDEGDKDDEEEIEDEGELEEWKEAEEENQLGKEEEKRKDGLEKKMEDEQKEQKAGDEDGRKVDNEGNNENEHEEKPASAQVTQELSKEEDKDDGEEEEEDEDDFGTPDEDAN